MKSVGDAPRTRPQRLSTHRGDPVQVTESALLRQAWQAVTLAIGAARIHRKPAPRTSVRRFKTAARRGSYPAKRRGTGLS